MSEHKLSASELCNDADMILDTAVARASVALQDAQRDVVATFRWYVAKLQNALGKALDENDGLRAENEQLRAALDAVRQQVEADPTNEEER